MNVDYKAGDSVLIVRPDRIGEGTVVHVRLLDSYSLIKINWGYFSWEYRWPENPMWKDVAKLCRRPE
jgi:hypothetical protein